MKSTKYHQDPGSTAACTKRIMELMKGLGKIRAKVIPSIVLFLAVGLPQRGYLKLYWILMLTPLVSKKKILSGFVEKPSRT